MRFKVGDKIKIVRDLGIYRNNYSTLMEIQDRQGCLIIRKATIMFDNTGKYEIVGHRDVGWDMLDEDAQLYPFEIKKPRRFKLTNNV